jgi:hypothetical protein
MRGQQDLRLIEQMEALALVAGSEPARQRLTAAFKLLSPFMQRLYEARGPPASDRLKWIDC